MEPDASCQDQTYKAGGPLPQCRDRHSLLHARDGTIRLEAEGLRWTVPPGRAALIQADQPITVTIPSRLVSTTVLFAKGFIPEPGQTLAVFEMSPLARELIQALRARDAAGAPLPGATARMFQTLGDVVLDLAQTPSPCVLPAPKSDRLAQAMTLAEANLENLPSFGEIARASGQSTRSLTRRCTEELGMSWRDLIRRMRMIRAIETLATTTLPVTEIAIRVGYTSLSGFNEAFRDLTGTSPTDYRTSFRA